MKNFTVLIIDLLILFQVQNDYFLGVPGLGAGGTVGAGGVGAGGGGVGALGVIGG